MRLQILGSSSSGNCALLETEDCKALIDAGFSGRRLGAMLGDRGVSLGALDAVFLTHEHTDHAGGLRGLGKLSHLQFFANHDTARKAQENLTRRMRWRVFETGLPFRFRDLEITAFSLPHDASDPVGYVFKQKRDGSEETGASAAWVTDLGYIPRLVEAHVREADVLVLESNHDPRMLDEHPSRPWSLKQRIKSRHGHLSNGDARAFLCGVESPRWRQVYLAHLSRDCNEVALVESFYTGGNGGGPPCPVRVVDPVNGGCPPLDL